MDMTKNKKGRVPRKVVCYLPIPLRLRRMHGNKTESKLMRWHAEGGNNEDDVLRHLVDACQWSESKVSSKTILVMTKKI